MVYCKVDQNGVCIGVLTIDDEAFMPPADYIRADTADTSWIKTKRWNSLEAVWEDYTAPLAVLTKYQFITRFTRDEFTSILTAMKTDPNIEAYYLLVMAAPEIDLNDQNVIEGLEFLVANNLLTEARKAEIMGANQ